MMNLLGLLVPKISDIVSKAIPDKDLQTKVQQELAKMANDSELKALEQQFQLQMAQIEVNKVDAGSGDKFQSRWRPFIGWVAGVGVAFQVVLAPFIEYICRLFGYPVDLPVLDANLLMFMLSALLGLSISRTYEKIKLPTPFK